MTPLSAFTFHELLTTPTPPDTDSGARASLFAALTAAHAELLTPDHDTGVLVAWQRRPGSRTVQVLLGGAPHFPPAAHTDTPDDTTPIMYPPGARGRRIHTSHVLAEWSAIPVWLRCTGRSDALWADTAAGSAPAPTGRGGFEDHITHMPGQFVWLVHAQPLPPEAVDTEMTRLEIALPRWRARENSEHDRIALSRAQSRYRELARGRSPGMWAIHLLVGAHTDHACRRAAGLLCSAADLDQLPYVLTPHPRTDAFTETWHTTPITDAEEHSPFLGSTELLTSLARPPRRELPGIRAVESIQFDLTPEHDGDIDLGTILDNADQPAGRLGIPLSTLNRHGFIAGATGSGKSQTVRHLLEGLHTAGIPWLVIEPAKSEYAGMAGRLRQPVTIIRPGDPDAVPIGLNPLEPAPGFPLQTHIDLLRALFLAAFDAVEPFPQVLSHALTRCYNHLGWDTILDEPHPDRHAARYPTLTDLQTTALQVVDDIGYGREITDNVRGFIDVRLSSLRLGTPGRFFEGRYRCDIADLLTRNTVIEIEDIGSDADKAFLIGTVLIRLFEHLRAHHQPTADNPLRHITVIEEAHRLLRRAEPGTPAAHAVELFTALLAEIRANGTGIIVAEQIPTKISPDIIKNTALKIVHRLPAADDRDLVGATMNLDPAQSRHAVSLPPGHAIVFTDGMDRPIRVTVPYGGPRETRTTNATPKLSPPPTHPPLTLRALHHAHHLADDPHLTLWIELLLLAHLVGQPAPTPTPEWIATLTDTTPPAALTEAITHRLHLAITDRYTGLARYYHPTHLQEHLLHTALAHVHNHPSPCNSLEPHWQAGRYRWTDIEEALNNPALSQDQPHPDTHTWTHRGIHLPSTTLTDQLHALHNHPDNHTDRTIVTGTHTLLATTLARLSNSPAPDHRLQQATPHLHNTRRWPLALLTTDMS
ncbi:ATP-binding protein [Nocardia takedensis]|uniref:ATP-binding protein n=1 Tax=Nocardia takedensis TaxID=259390 RepID=UPI003F76C39D